MSFNELFGSIPDGWRSCTLGELVKEFNGSIQTGPFGSQLHAADYVEDGIPSIMPKNIRIDGVDDSDIARVSPEDIERLSKYKVQTGDIVYSRRGDVEKCSLITEKENGWLCGTGCLRVRLQTEEVSPEFLHAYLCHPAVREWIVRHAVGATMPNLNTSILSALPVLVPTSDSMAAITSNWNAISSKLVINSKINQTLEEMAQVIFKSWFVDFDPVKAKMNGEQPEGMDAATASLFPEKLVESELGLIPEGWDAVQVGDIVQRLKPKKRYTKKQVEPYGKTPVYEQGASILLGFHNDDAGFDASPEDPVFIFGDHTCITHLSCSKFDISSNVIPLKGSVRPTIWTYYAIQGKQEFQEYRRHWSEFIIKDVVLPPVELAEKYAELVTTKYLMMESLKRQSKELDQLRDTLLPKLLSGEIELVEQS
ncbi:restriction endonuclease subunit S [Vibrio antiquarius]|uniref:restriction endonuclease subunit S n=1 Tax=Vibrio antiquarius (strain Ex25) TaxID=150340 RepID=UPI00265A531B|nr:restriction endonuclease subunit S [Vibrio antiquarius]MCR9985558.1 restriction endonuclease subunit S [Vibrio antiquarius]